MENNTKTIIISNIKYLINEEDNSVGVVGSINDVDELIIPRLITYESKDYFVTSILEGSFKKSKIISIQFPPDSVLLTIEKEAFFESPIESINIPSSCTNLKEGWCSDTPKLNKVSVSPDNPCYKTCCENKIIIGKASQEQANYDCLIFCSRDIETIKIPDFIEHICPYAFQKCERLVDVEITENSKLRTIGDFAFNESFIDSIRIPKQVTRIGKSAFLECKCLGEVEFAQDSKLQIIEENAFNRINIGEIKIPSEVTSIGKQAFGCCIQLQEVIFPDDSKLRTIEKEAFMEAIFESITIPSEVTQIKEGAFKSCYYLYNIEFKENSKLQTIEKEAFSFSLIESINIPLNCTDLKEGWCSHTLILNQINVSPNNPCYKTFFNDKFLIGKTSKEQTNYDCLIFCARDIKTIKIPDFIEHIYPYAFEYCNKLTEIVISENSKLRTIGNYAFNESAIESINIPTKLIKFKEEWCSCTPKLNKISITSDNPYYKTLCNGKILIGKTSNEQTNYDCLIFCSRNIKTIKIPDFIEHICPCAFQRCAFLKQIEFTQHSKLKIIDKYAFHWSSIRSIKIPSTVSKIGKYAFSTCRNLHQIDIPENSKLQMIEEYAFLGSQITSISIHLPNIYISESAFFDCRTLQIIEINYNLITEENFKNVILKCINAIIMISD